MDTRTIINILNIVLENQDDNQLIGFYILAERMPQAFDHLEVFPPIPGVIKWLVRNDYLAKSSLKIQNGSTISAYRLTEKADELLRQN